MAAVGEKPLPVTLSVKAAEPAVVVVGVNEEMVGPEEVAGVMVKARPELETPDWETVTSADPVAEIRLAGTEAERRLEEE
jgi:hypothetical protein